MNTTKQLWALLKFQTTINPFIWFMPLAIAFPSLHLFGSSTYVPSLNLCLSNFSLFMTAFITFMVLAPDFFIPATSSNVWSPGTDFLITRATDRRVIYRSKAVLLYLLLLAIPLMLLVASLRNPALITEEYSKAVPQAAVRLLPGTTLKESSSGMAKLVIPQGQMLISGWTIWTTLLFTLPFQLFFAAFAPSKFSRYLFMAAYGVIITAPMWMLYASIGSHHDQLTFIEKLFFWFGSHQLLAWFVILLFALGVQLWSEHRFARREQL